MSRMLNLGCGATWHPSWTNIDFSSSCEHVLAQNLRQPLLFSDNNFEAVYHSHVLEHFPKSDAERFMKECHRVLRPGGIIRVVVPDFEWSVQGYLESLSRAKQRLPGWAQNHEWMMIELLDYLVRNEADGEREKFLQKENVLDEAFIRSRLNRSLKDEVASLKSRISMEPTRPSLFWRALRGVFRLMNCSRYRSAVFARLLLSAGDRQALDTGRIRLGGNVHLWMYDRFSLETLLVRSGFTSVICQKPAISLIPSWFDYSLDTTMDGKVRRRGSLYMEGIKGNFPG